MTYLDARLRLAAKSLTGLAASVALALSLTLAQPHQARAEGRPLSFAVGGVVAEVLVKPGDTVAAGQPLAKLDLRPFQAHVDSADAGLRAANLTAQTAAANLTRTQALYEDVSASGEALEQAQIAAADAEARRALAEASARLAGWRLERAILQAPAAGRIEAVPGYIGLVVTPEGVNPPVVILDQP